MKHELHGVTPEQNLRKSAAKFNNCISNTMKHGGRGAFLDAGIW